MALTAADVNPDQMPKHYQRPEPEEDTRDSRKRDPEILQLERIARMLDELDEPARARVVAYLSDRYAPCRDPISGRG